HTAQQAEMTRSGGCESLSSSRERMFRSRLLQRRSRRLSARASNCRTESPLRVPETPSAFHRHARCGQIKANQTEVSKLRPLTLPFANSNQSQKLSLNSSLRS